MLSPISMFVQKEMKPTFHTVSQHPFQLSPRVAPGTKLQQRQRKGNARWGHDQVGAVLCLGDRLVQADGEAVVELPHAVLEAAGTVASLHQPNKKEEGSH